MSDGRCCSRLLGATAEAHLTAVAGSTQGLDWELLRGRLAAARPLLLARWHYSSIGDGRHNLSNIDVLCLDGASHLTRTCAGQATETHLVATSAHILGSKLEFLR